MMNLNLFLKTNCDGGYSFFFPIKTTQNKNNSFFLKKKTKNEKRGRQQQLILNKALNSYSSV